MSTILQDMMGMLKRNGTVTPKSDNYITLARYPNPQERLKPAPKLQTELVTLSQLKIFFNAGAGGDKQQLSLAGQVLSLTNGGSVTLPDEYVNSAGFDAATNLLTLTRVSGDSIQIDLSDNIPYSTSIARISQSGTGDPTLSFISNDAGLVLGTDVRLGVGQYRFEFSGVPPDASDVMVILPGGIKNGQFDVVFFNSSYAISGGTGTLLIDSYGYNAGVVNSSDVGFGGDNSFIIEIRVFN